MRIIAGEARGRSIAAPKGMDTRPTLDRVRESLFSILTQKISGAHILDLFAGSGALGLEGLSRGAADAVFVDHGRLAQAAVQRNLETLGLRERAELLKCDWKRALLELSAKRVRFDLVFLDPPYRFLDISTVFFALWKEGLVMEDGLIIYEHDARSQIPANDWRIVDDRRYGDTSITFFSR